jgi:hypothetical protein
MHKSADPTAGARKRPDGAKDAKAGRNRLRALLDVSARQESGGLRSWAGYKPRIGEVFAK